MKISNRLCSKFSFAIILALSFTSQGMASQPLSSTSGNGNSVEIFSPSWSSGIPASGQKGFWIKRKGDNIGFHYMTFEKVGDQVHVNIHIEIKISIGFIPVFGYVHQNKEIWENGQLVSMVSRTDNNGKPEYAKITRDENGFLKSESSRYSGIIDNAVMTTSYFNPDFVKQSHIISTQDGRELKVLVQNVGTHTVNASNRTVEAYRFRLSGDLPLDIWYTPSGDWVRSAFLPAGDDVNNVDPLSRGDVITYEEAIFSELPQPSTWRMIK